MHNTIQNPSITLACHYIPVGSEVVGGSVVSKGVVGGGVVGGGVVGRAVVGGGGVGWLLSVLQYYEYLPGTN